ncbi:MAG TPA: hypothetical protein VKR32_07275 [Puia sp.]|nr:hypothetical protein [Puia sp.]
MKLSNWILIVVPAISVASCQKSNPSVLPPITQTGENTFGLKVNGKVWVPHFTCGYFSNPCAELTYSILAADSIGWTPIWFSLIAGNDAGDHSYFQIGPFSDSSFFHQPGNIADSLNITFSVGPPFVSNELAYQKYPGIGNNNFEVTKLDTINKIISGTFSLTLYNGNLNSYDSVNITDGRFDLRFGDYCHCSQ